MILFDRIQDGRNQEPGQRSVTRVIKSTNIFSLRALSPCALFFLVVILLSCEKKATIKLPKPESKLVVTCFITPDDTLISAVVRLSTPKFGPVDSTSVFVDDIRDANITISD